jgi:pseudaminic acid synthase
MKFRIGKKLVGDGERSFLVAEMSGNHSGKLSNALKIVKLAKKCGADAIKLQTYTSNTITLNSSKKDFRISKKSPWHKYKTLWNLYDYAHTPWEWHKKIFLAAKKNNLSFFSSPFDESAVDFLENIGCQAYKLASPEITHIPLIEKISKTNKPVIISTGLASQKEIETALNILKKNNSKKIIVLKCSSSYPAQLDELNLKTMQDMKKRYKTLVGFSDHSIGSIAGITATVLGGSMLEKHFTHDEKKKSVDSFFSAGPKNFKDMVKQIREAEKSMGKINYQISKKSKISLNGRRSIYISQNVDRDDIVSLSNIKVVRPSYGLSPKFYKKVLGKKFLKKLKKGDRLNIKHLR